MQTTGWKEARDNDGENLTWLFCGSLSIQSSLLYHLGEHLVHDTGAATELGNQGFPANGELFDCVAVSTRFLSGRERNPAQPGLSRRGGD